MSLIVVQAIRGEFRDSNCNGFGDIWWTHKLICFSSMDGYIPFKQLFDLLKPIDVLHSDWSQVNLGRSCDCLHKLLQTLNSETINQHDMTIIRNHQLPNSNYHNNMFQHLLEVVRSVLMKKQIFH